MAFMSVMYVKILKNSVKSLVPYQKDYFPPTFVQSCPFPNIIIEGSGK